MIYRPTHKNVPYKPSCKQYSHTDLTLKPFMFEGLREGLEDTWLAIK